MNIRFYYLQQAIRKGKVVDSITSFVGRVGPYKFLHLKKILKKDLAKILEDFLS